MDGKGNLTLDFLDVYGERPDDQVDVLLKHSVLNQTVRVRNQTTTKRLRIAELESTHGGRFNLQIFPMRHRPVNRFVRILEDTTVQQSIVLAIASDRVTEVQFPHFESLGPDLKQVLRESTVEGYEDKQGEQLYAALDDVRKAGMLNIYARMKAIGFANGLDPFSYITSFTRIRADRCFARVARQMRDEVKNSTHTQVFREVPNILHTPPPGFMSAGAFKTTEVYCNLQLAFFHNRDTDEFISDIDIDDDQGFEHVFQVLRPATTEQSTSPYDIHQILLVSQKIDTGYRLIV